MFNLLFINMLKTFKLNEEIIEYSARKVYGLIITLALIISLQKYQTNSLNIIITIVGSLLVIALAEIYVHYVTLSSKKRKKLSYFDIKCLIKKEFNVMFASEIPVILFFLEFIGIISLDLAFFLAQVFGILALFVFGYILGKNLEKDFLGKLFFGLISSLFGIFIISLKIFFH